MNRQQQITKRLDQILSDWLRANRQERDRLLMERIRLERELEELKRADR